MSSTQFLGIQILRGLSVLLLITAVFSAVLTMIANGSYAAQLVDGWGNSALAILFSVVIDLMKIGLPLAIWYLRYRSPRFAASALTFFCACAMWSVICGFGWAMSVPVPEVPPQTVAELNALYAGQQPLMWAGLMLFAQVASAGGPLMVHVFTESATEKPFEEPYRMPPQPVAQPHALPSPDSEETIRSAFGDWIKARLSLIPTAQTALGAALANYTSWARENMQIQIHPRDFEFLMNEAAAEAGASVSDGIYTGLWFADREHHPITVG